MLPLSHADASTAPEGYKIPGWPALTIPWATEQKYLYYPSSVWRYTIYWTLTMTTVVWGLSGMLAFIVLSRKGKKYAVRAIWVPVGFVMGGCIASFTFATVVGFALAAVYNAAYLRMSTWVPFLWAAVHTLIVIASSYTTVANIL